VPRDDERCLTAGNDEDAPPDDDRRDAGDLRVGAGEAGDVRGDDEKLERESDECKYGEDNLGGSDLGPGYRLTQQASQRKPQHLTTVGHKRSFSAGLGSRRELRRVGCHTLFCAGHFPYDTGGSVVRERTERP